MRGGLDITCDNVHRAKNPAKDLQNHQSVLLVKTLKNFGTKTKGKNGIDVPITIKTQRLNISFWRNCFISFKTQQQL